jgi:hypothetical protein
MNHPTDHCHNATPAQIKVTASCCAAKPNQDNDAINSHGASCHPAAKRDTLLWSCALAVVALYMTHVFFSHTISNIDWLHTLSHSVFEITNTVWWGVLFGLSMIGVLSKISREFIISILGGKPGLNGLLRATAAGLLLDLCSHGILMVGSKLYERGASTGQVIAFLIASPWNSFSLTLILISLIGLSWTLAFIALSMLIAIIAGSLFDALVAKGTLPDNPNKITLADDFDFIPAAKASLKATTFSASFLLDIVKNGARDSTMVLRWLLLGILIAAALRAFIPGEFFSELFGPTLLGLSLTILAATVIEVCSEGSTPIAADIFNRADAPGNSFAFLMAGVSTDYTEILVLQQMTRSVKIALLLPLITLPQIIVLGYVLNQLT